MKIIFVISIYCSKQFSLQDCREWTPILESNETVDCWKSETSDESQLRRFAKIVSKFLLEDVPDREHEVIRARSVGSCNPAQGRHDLDVNDHDEGEGHDHDDDNHEGYYLGVR